MEVTQDEGAFLMTELMLWRKNSEHQAWMGDHVRADVLQIMKDDHGILCFQSTGR